MTYIISIDLSKSLQMIEKNLGIQEYFLKQNEALGGLIAGKVLCNYVTQLKTQGVYTVAQLFDMGDLLQFQDLPEALYLAVVADRSRSDRDSTGESFIELQPHQRRSWTAQGYCLCTKSGVQTNAVTLNCGHSVCKPCLGKYIESYLHSFPTSETVPCPYSATMIGENCLFGISLGDHKLILSPSIGNSTRCPECGAAWFYPYTQKECLSCATPVCQTCAVPHAQSQLCTPHTPCPFCGRSVVSGVNDLQSFLYRLELPSGSALKQKLGFPLVITLPPHLSGVCDGMPSKGAVFPTLCPTNAFMSCGKVLSCGCSCKGLKGEIDCSPCVNCNQEQCTQCTMPLSESCWIKGGAGLITTNSPTPTNNDHIASNHDIHADEQCPHSYHLDCVRMALQSKWSGNRINFNFLNCCCGKLRAHPAIFSSLLPLQELREQVRLACERRCIDDDEDVKEAIEKYVFYQCSRCKQAYHAGAVSCQGSDAQEVDPALLLCSSCNPPIQGACQQHGSEFQRHKCKYCCSVSASGCWGNTYFCPKCHKSGEWQKLAEHRTGRNKMGQHEYKQCSSLQAQISALRAQESFQRLTVFEQEEKLGALRCEPAFCPLKVAHPPNGVNFVLGCGACDSECLGSTVVYDTKQVPMRMHFRMPPLKTPQKEYLKQKWSNQQACVRNVGRARIHVSCSSPHGILYTQGTAQGQMQFDAADAAHAVLIRSSNHAKVTLEQVTTRGQGVVLCSPDSDDRYVEQIFPLCSVQVEYIQQLPLHYQTPRFAVLEGSNSQQNQWVELQRVENCSSNGQYFVGSVLPVSRQRIRFEPCTGFTEGYAQPLHGVELYGDILLTHLNSSDNSNTNQASWLIPYMHPPSVQGAAPSTTIEEEKTAALIDMVASEEEPQQVVHTQNQTQFLQSEWTINAVQQYAEGGLNVSSLLMGSLVSLTGAPPKQIIDTYALRLKCDQVEQFLGNNAISCSLHMFTPDMRLVPQDNTIPLRFIVVLLKSNGFESIDVNRIVISGVVDTTQSTALPEGTLSKDRKSYTTHNVTGNRYIKSHSYAVQSTRYEEFAPANTITRAFLHQGDGNGIQAYLRTRGGTATGKSTAIPHASLVSRFQINVRSAPLLRTSSPARQLLTGEPCSFSTAPSSYPFLCFDQGVCNTCDLTAYSLTRTGSSDVPVTWALQGSEDGCHWTQLVHHCEDHRLVVYSSASWVIPPAPHAPSSRYLLLVSTAPSNFGNSIQSLGAIEFYGTMHFSPHPRTTTGPSLYPSLSAIRAQYSGHTAAVCVQELPSVPLPHLGLSCNHPWLTTLVPPKHHPIQQPRTHLTLSFPPLLSSYLNPTGTAAVYRCPPGKLPFLPSSVIAFLGSGGGTAVYSCPVAQGRASLTSSSPTSHRLSALLGDTPCSITIPLISADNPFIAIDTGALTQVSHFSLRAGVENFPKTFQFQGSLDATSWTTLSHHLNDACLTSPHAAQCYPIGIAGQKQWFRYFRWVHHGKNHSNNFNFTLGGLDLYGKIKIFI